MAIGSLVQSLLQYSISHPLLFTVYALLACVIGYVGVTELQRAKARIPGFNGPTGFPMIGNIHQIRVNAAEQYRLWSEKHGPVFQIMLGNVPVIVVNSAAAARELFGANAQALSSRPEFYTFHKVVSSTAGTTIGTSPFSESLKRRRKGAASALNKPSIMTYIPHIDLETKAFVQEFLEYGSNGTKAVDPMPMIQRLSLSLALTLNWGTRIASQSDSLFDEICYVEEEVSKFRSTTGNLQDYIPILRLNPFNGGKAKAKDMRRRRDVYLNRLNNDLDDRMEKGTHQPCIQANVILDKEAKLNKEELTSISLTMLSGGLDTLTTLVAWSMALLAERPEIQEKALREIRAKYPLDSSNPHSILCDENDDQSIAYIVALIKEFLRYYTVLRLSLPRASTKPITSSFNNGAVIPSGTVVFLNAWACNMDPQVWGADWADFRPERWLEKPDAPLFTYGLGYRMCAGSLLANREMYTIYLRLLSCFEIKGLVGEGGHAVNTHPVKGVEDQTQLVSVPRRYKVRMIPRDENALKEALQER